MAYLGNPLGGIRGRFIYTATAGQTTFSGTDDYNRTLSYTDAEFTDVFLNGVKLDKSDYTATSGTSVVLDEGAAADDILEVLAFDTFSVFSGEFSQDVTVGGKLTTDNINGGQIGGRRNLIINGGMQVAQYGTSVSAKTDANKIHTVDRWRLEASGATYDVAQSSDTPNGFLKSQKVTLDGAFTPTASQYFIPFEQRIEAQNTAHLAYGTSDAKSVTLSFWIKSSKTGTYVVEFRNTDASKQWPKSYTIDTANTWEKKTLTWTGDTVSGTEFAVDNGQGAVFFWWMTAGTTYTSGTLPTGWEANTNANRAAGVPSSLADNDEFYLTGVQLEVGSTATEFEYLSYAEELSLCQRYFYSPTHRVKVYGATHNSGSFNPDLQFHESYVCEMRANPTITTYTNSAKTTTGRTMTNTSGGAPSSVRTTGFEVNVNITSSNIGGVVFYYNADAEI